MELRFHGAASEVGRSCIELRSEGHKYLLDVGVKFSNNGLEFPKNVKDIKSFEGVFLTHAHMDHAGGLPLFEHKQLEGPIFCTRQTLAISKILLKDSFKVARIKHLHPEYDNNDLKQVTKDTKVVSFDKWYKHKNLRFKFLNAGHIPGSAMILFEVEGKKLLYTGDFNLRKSLLMFKAELSNELKDVDILITESTYGYRELPDREKEQWRFVKTVEETVKNGGSVIIPVFSLGRAQEALLMLNHSNLKVPIYFDGLCNKLTRKILSNKSKYVDNKSSLYDMFYEKVQWVSSESKRKRIVKKQGVFVTTSGMIQGGPVMNYLKSLYADSKNSVLLMGFQIKGSNGRSLLEENQVVIDGEKLDVKCIVDKFDFSGHSGRKDIEDFVKHVNPEHVFFQHGDLESVTAMKDWAEKELNIKSYAPKIDDKYTV